MQIKSMDKQNTRGGSRKGAGRKPLKQEYRKQQVSIYVQPSEIDFLGGKDAVKELLINYLDYYIQQLQLIKKTQHGTKGKEAAL